jgi:hypothetical protein
MIVTERRSNLTRTSIREYAAALRDRYRQASKADKNRMLDEFCQVTGYHRKSAIRLLCHPPKAITERRGRSKEYCTDAAQGFKVAWEATDRVCSKRLAPFLPELIPTLERRKELVSRTPPGRLRPLR